MKTQINSSLYLAKEFLKVLLDNKTKTAYIKRPKTSKVVKAWSGTREKIHIKTKTKTSQPTNYEK